MGGKKTLILGVTLLPHSDPAKSNLNNRRNIAILGRMGLKTAREHPPVTNFALCDNNKPLVGINSFQKKTFELTD